MVVMGTKGLGGRGRPYEAEGCGMKRGQGIMGVGRYEG